ncbi:MAG TPA: hypothetical protein VEW46_06840 [Pyrinomonadaceae bacterium]|nr:hypothetical protein [Pyrinomonadaceae bacterium]
MRAKHEAHDAPRIMELEQRNRQRLADGTVKMNEIIKVAAARLMI